VVVQVARVDRDRLVVLAFLVLLAPAAGVEAVEQDFLPVDLFLVLVVDRGFLRFLLRFGLGLLAVLLLHFLRLDHVEEGIVEQFLLEVLLEVEQRHVEQVHRLVEARIDLQLLLEPRDLGQAGLHDAISGFSALKRARRRAASVGPR
jgi:hypothetical protein